MSIKNKKVFVNSDKVIIFVLAAALLSTYLTAGTMVVSNRFVLKNNAPVQGIPLTAVRWLLSAVI